MNEDGREEIEAGWYENGDDDCFQIFIWSDFQFCQIILLITGK